MYILEASEYLIDEELDVFVADGLTRLDDLWQVCFHELRDYIDVLKALDRFWFEQTLDWKNIVVAE